MALFVASLLAGLTLGGTFALISLGLVLAFRATKTFNFAHGELMVLPAFIVAFMTMRGFAMVLSIAVALGVSALVGAALYVFVLRRATGLHLFMAVIATLGVAAILDGLMGVLFREPQYHITLDILPTGLVSVAGATVSQSSLVLAAFTVLLSVAVAVVFRTTHLGIMVRAAGQDPLLASQSGISVRWMYIGSWVVAAVLAGVAGIAYGSSAVVDTSMIGLGLAALPAVVLGGLDSIEGAVLGGLAVGILEGLAQTYLGGQYVNVIVYSLLLLVLLFYPSGILGTREALRA